jgi:hypothetical protein
MPNQPKKYRIVMRARAAGLDGDGNELRLRKATVIDADHMDFLSGNDNIYLVGIGVGNGPTKQQHCRHPKAHHDFWIIKHTAPGQSDRPKDPSHSDWLVTPKFQKVISMHAKNIDTINGKPVLYVGNDTRDTSQLGQFDEWNINNIADLLGE